MTANSSAYDLMTANPRGSDDQDEELISLAKEYAAQKAQPDPLTDELVGLANQYKTQKTNRAVVSALAEGGSDYASQKALDLGAPDLAARVMEQKVTSDETKTEQEYLTDEFRKHNAVGRVVGGAAFNIIGKARSLALRLGGDILTGESADEWNRYQSQMSGALDEAGGYGESTARAVLQTVGESVVAVGIGGLPAMAAYYGATGTNEAITEGRDAGLTGAKLGGYSVAMGTSEALMTLAGARLGKVGARIVAPVAGKLGKLTGSTALNRISKLTNLDPETILGDAGKQAVQGALDSNVKRAGTFMATVGLSGLWETAVEEVPTTIVQQALRKSFDVDEKALDSDVLWKAMVDTARVSFLAGGGMAGIGGIETIRNQNKVKSFIESPSRKTMKALPDFVTASGLELGFNLESEDGRKKFSEALRDKERDVVAEAVASAKKKDAEAKATAAAEEKAATATAQETKQEAAVEEEIDEEDAPNADVHNQLVANADAADLAGESPIPTVEPEAPAPTPTAETEVTEVPTDVVETRPRFQQQREISEAALSETIESLRKTKDALTPEQIAEITNLSEALMTDATTEMAEGRVGKVRHAVAERAKAFVKQHGVKASYFVADVKNLGGLNSTFGDVEANKIFRALADIFRKSLNVEGADIHFFRHGGDEISAIAVGMTDEQVESAIEAMSATASAYVAEAKLADKEGREVNLSQIPHAKYKEDLTKAGTGITVAATDIGADDDIGEVFKQAGIELERRKEGLKDGEQGTPPGTGDSASGEGQASTARGPKQAIGRVPPQVSQSTSVPTETKVAPPVVKKKGRKAQAVAPVVETIAEADTLAEVPDSVIENLVVNSSTSPTAEELLNETDEQGKARVARAERVVNLNEEMLTGQRDVAKKARARRDGIIAAAKIMGVTQEEADQIYDEAQLKMVNALRGEGEAGLLAQLEQDTEKGGTLRTGAAAKGATTESAEFEFLNRLAAVDLLTLGFTRAAMEARESGNDALARLADMAISAYANDRGGFQKAMSRPAIIAAINKANAQQGTQRQRSILNAFANKAKRAEQEVKAAAGKAFAEGRGTLSLDKEVGDGATLADLTPGEGDAFVDEAIDRADRDIESELESLTYGENEVNPDDIRSTKRGRTMAVRKAVGKTLSAIGGSMRNVIIVNSVLEAAGLMHGKRAKFHVEAGDRATLRGFWSPQLGRIVLIADNLVDDAQAIKTYIHELFHSGMAGMRENDASRLNAELDAIAESLGDEKIIELATKYKRRMAADKTPPGVSLRRMIAEEYMAHEWSNGNQSVRQRMINWAKKWLNRLSVRLFGNKNALYATDAKIIELLDAAMAEVRRRSGLLDQVYGDANYGSMMESVEADPAEIKKIRNEKIRNAFSHVLNQIGVYEAQGDVDAVRQAWAFYDKMLGNLSEEEQATAKRVRPNMRQIKSTAAKVQRIEDKIAREINRRDENIGSLIKKAINVFVNKSPEERMDIASYGVQERAEEKGLTGLAAKAKSVAERGKSKMQVTKALSMAESVALEAWNKGKADDASKKKLIAQALKDILPAAYIKRLVVKLAEAHTPRDMDKLIDKIDLVALKAEHDAAINELRKQLRRAHKFNLKDTAFGKMFPAYRDMMRGLTEGVDDKRRSDTFKAIRDGILSDENVERMKKELTDQEEIDHLDSLAKKARSLENTTSVDDMSIEEINELASKIEELLAKQKEYSTERRSKFGESVGQVREEIINSIKSKFERQGVAFEGGLLRRFSNFAIEDLRTVAMLLDQDEAGPMHRLVESLEDAGGNRFMLGKDLEMRLSQALQASGLTKQDLEAFSQLSPKDPEMVTVQVGDNEVKMTRAQRAQIYNLARDTEGYDLLTKVGMVVGDHSPQGLIGKIGKKLRMGRENVVIDSPMTAEDIAALREQVEANPADKAVADIMFDLVNGFGKDMVNSYSMQRNGYQVANKPAYWMISRWKSDVIGDKSGQTDEDINGNVTVSGPLEAVSYLKERTDSKAKLFIPDIMQSFTTHMDSVMDLTAYGIPVQFAKAVWRNPNMKASMQHTLGSDTWKAFDKMLENLEGKAEKAEGVAKALMGIKNKYAVSVLALNIKSMLSQPISYFAASAELNARHMAKAVAARAITKGDKEAIDEIRKRTPIMLSRQAGDINLDVGQQSFGNAAQDMLFERKRFGGIVPTPTTKQLMSGLRVMDKITVDTLALASFYQTQAEMPGASRDQVIERAAKLTNKVIRITQPGGEQGSKTLLDSTVVGRMLFMFRSPAKAAMTTLLYSMRRYQANRTAANQYKLAKAIGSVVVVMPLLSAALTAVFAAMREDDDDRKRSKRDGRTRAKDIAVKAAMESISSIPAFGTLMADIADAANRGQAPEFVNIPAYDAIAETYKGIDGLLGEIGKPDVLSGTKRRKYERMWRDMEKSTAIFQAMGIPLPSVMRQLRAARNLVGEVYAEKRK